MSERATSREESRVRASRSADERRHVGRGEERGGRGLKGGEEGKTVCVCARGPSGSGAISCPHKQ